MPDQLQGLTFQDPATPQDASQDESKQASTALAERSTMPQESQGLQFEDPTPEHTFAGRAAETSGASAIIGLVSSEAKHRVDMFHHAIDSVRKGDLLQAGYAAYGALSGGDKDDPLAEAAKEIVLQPWEELKKAKKEAEKLDPASMPSPSILGPAGDFYNFITQNGKPDPSGKPSLPGGEVARHLVGAVPLVGAAGEAVGEPIAEDLKDHNWSALAGDIVGAGLTFGIGAAIDHFGKIKAGAHESPKTMYHVRDVGTKDIPATSQGTPSFKTAVEKLKPLKPSPANVTVPNQGTQPSVPQEIVAFDLNKAAKDATYQQTKVVPESLVERITTQPATIGETAPKALEPKAAGEAVQAGVEKTRSELGEKVGEAKDEVKDTLPHGVFGEEGALPLSATGKAATTAKDIMANEWLDDDIKPLFQKYASTSEDNPVRMTANDFDKEMNHMQQKIDTLQNAADKGANATKLGQMKKLRSSLNTERYDLWMEHGDPVKVQNLKELSAQYGKLIDDIKTGPAKDLLSSNSPSNIVQKIIAGGAKSQEAVESIMSHLDTNTKEVFKDSLLREFYNHSKNNMMKMSDGTMGYDAGNLAKNFRHLRGTAEAAFGKTLTNQLQELYDVSAKLQVENSMKATRAAQKSKLIKKGVAKIGGAAVGGAKGGAAGAIIGAVAGHEIEGILNIGKDGIIKVGIAPDEIITLTPQELGNPGRMAQVVKFAKAAASGSQDLMRVSYNNIVSPAIKMAATGGKAGMVVEGSKKDKLSNVMSGAANALGGSAKEAP